MAKTRIEIVGDISEDEWVDRWPQIRLDQFNHIEFMTTETLDLLNIMCKEAEIMHSWAHTINSDFRDDDKGQHGLGKAIDLVFYFRTPGDVNVIEQFVFALRFNWSGIGFYPYWFIPGIHVDTRELNKPYKALWWRGKDRKYYAGDEFMNNLNWEMNA